jgi:hypothetical protein
MDYTRAFQALVNADPSILRSRKPPKNLIERLKSVGKRPTKAQMEKAAAEERLAALKAKGKI